MLYSKKLSDQLDRSADLYNTNSQVCIAIRLLFCHVSIGDSDSRRGKYGSERKLIKITWVESVIIRRYRGQSGCVFGVLRSNEFACFLVPLSYI